MNTIEAHKNHIKNIQEESIHKTQEMLKLLEETNEKGTQSLEMLNDQYEQLQRINNHTENINENLEKSTTLLGKIKYFFFPRKVTKIKKFSKNVVSENGHEPHNNIFPEKSRSHIEKSPRISNEFIDKSLEDKLDRNLDEISIGVSNLKNIALTMNDALDRDKELLDSVQEKSKIVNSNIKKVNKEITKLL